MKPRIWLFLALLALTAARFQSPGRIELTPDESYHTLWCLHPDWCYYDAGPVIAMIIRAGTELLGLNEFGIRFFSPIIALGSSLILFLLTRKLYGETVAVWTVAVMNILPVFQSGSLMMNPGGLSVCLLASAMLTFWLALERGPGFSIYWPVTGLLTGAGFLTEYTGALALLSMALLLASTGKYRREFARPGFWVMLVFFIPFTIPVVRWNAQHEWITLLLWRGRFAMADIHVRGMLNWFSECALSLSPLVFAGMLIAGWWGVKKARHQFKPRFLLFFSLPLLALGIFGSSSKPATMNSMMPAFAGLVILSAALWHEAAKADKKRAIFAVLAVVTGIGFTIYDTGSACLRGDGLHPWKSAAIAIGETRKQLEQKTGKPVFLIGNNDRVASIVSFYLPEKRVEGPGHPPVYIPESQMIESQFSYWPRYDEFFAVAKDAPHPDAYYTLEEGVNPFMGRTALFVSDEVSAELPTAILNSFERIEPVPLNSDTLPVIRVFVCYNYRSLSL